MARLTVTCGEGEVSPFLRGILTHSLQHTGLSFEDSYEIASAVRDEFASKDGVTTLEVRKAVIRRLKRHHPKALLRYEAPRFGAAPILVRMPEGQSAPYSRGRHRQSLEACGIDPLAAARLSSAMYEDLVAHGTLELDIAELRRRTERRLQGELGEDAARRYVVWEEHRHGDRPLVLLIGGTTGTGKSTVSTRTAHMLDIVRTQSTDMLREVMRTMVPERLVPALHASSFRAWETLPGAALHQGADGEETHLIEGYLRQAELLAVAGDAVLRRASTERVSVVLEGVHVHPSFLADVANGTSAHVVRVMLGILRPQELERRIRGRGRYARARRAKRYLGHFPSIWRLQEFLLSEADRTGVPIVMNEDVDTAAHEIVQIVMRTLMRDHDARAANR